MLSSALDLDHFFLPLFRSCMDACSSIARPWLCSVCCRWDVVCRNRMASLLPDRIAFTTCFRIDTLIVLRFLSGVCGSAPPALGQATIADIFPPTERAPWSALYSLGPMLGPALGPFVGRSFVMRLLPRAKIEFCDFQGSFILTAKGWRWIFWCETCVCVLHT